MKIVSEFKPKPGKKGIHLPEESRQAILNIMKRENLSYVDVAKACGLTHRQVFKPMTKKGRCSRESLDALIKFIFVNKK